MMNGKEVFEMLSKMTEEERARCEFPGFFDDKEYDLLMSDTANNADLDDDEYQAVLDTKGEQVAQWIREAYDRNYEEWGKFVQVLLDEAAAKAIAQAKSGR